MTPRVAEVVAYIREQNLSPFSAFGPIAADKSRAFVGGGHVTPEEFRAVMKACFPPATLSVDAARASRNRALGAAARHER